MSNPPGGVQEDVAKPVPIPFPYSEGSLWPLCKAEQGSTNWKRRLGWIFGEYFDSWRILQFLDSISFLGEYLGFFGEYFIFRMAGISAQIQIHGCTDTLPAKRTLLL